MYRNSTSLWNRAFGSLDETGLLYVLPAFGLAIAISFALWVSGDQKAANTSVSLDLPNAHLQAETQSTTPFSLFPQASGTRQTDRPSLSLRPGSPSWSPEGNPSGNVLTPRPRIASESPAFPSE